MDEVQIAELERLLSEHSVFQRHFKEVAAPNLSEPTVTHPVDIDEEYAFLAINSEFGLTWYYRVSPFLWIIRAQISTSNRAPLKASQSEVLLQLCS